MQKYCAAAPGDARRAVVIDLDNEIVEMIIAPEPVTAMVAIPPHRPIVVAALRIFAPGIVGPDGANRQESARPRMAVGAPPQLPGPESTAWGSAIAFALVGRNTAAPKGNRDGLPACDQPAAARIAGRALNPDRGKWPIA